MDFEQYLEPWKKREPQEGNLRKTQRIRESQQKQFQTTSEHFLRDFQELSGKETSENHSREIPEISRHS